MKVTSWWRYLSEFLHGQTSETKTNKKWGGLALGGLKSEKNYLIGGLKTKILLAHLSKCLCLKKSNSIKLTLSNSTYTIFFFLDPPCLFTRQKGQVIGSSWNFFKMWTWLGSAIPLSKAITFKIMQAHFHNLMERKQQW